MSDDFMLTTKDNPYNPHTEFDLWWQWDEQEGYHTLALLGRVVKTSDDLPIPMQEQAYDDAINEIVSENVSGFYIKVARPKDAES